jgi:hypothetical protein
MHPKMLIPVYCLERLSAFLGCLTQRNFNPIIKFDIRPFEDGYIQIRPAK